MCACGSEVRGLVAVQGSWLNFIIVRVSSNQNDSVILFYDSVKSFHVTSILLC